MLRDFEFAFESKLGDSINSVTFSADGRRVYAGGDNGRVVTYDVLTWSDQVENKLRDTESILKIRVSRDEKTIVYAR